MAKHNLLVLQNLKPKRGGGASFSLACIQGWQLPEAEIAHAIVISGNDFRTGRITWVVGPHLPPIASMTSSSVTECRCKLSVVDCKDFPADRPLTSKDSLGLTNRWKSLEVLRPTQETIEDSIQDGSLRHVRQAKKKPPRRQDRDLALGHVNQLLLVARDYRACRQ